MKNRIGLLILVAALSCTIMSAQSNRERRVILNDYVSQEELVSMSKTLPFDKAVLLFSEFSKKYLNKIIIDVTADKKPIGVDIENMYWLQAFETVLRANQLWYSEQEEHFQVFAVVDSQKLSATRMMADFQKDSTGKVLLKSRDVKISSWFFSVDVVKSLNAGVNWSFLYSGDTTAKGTSGYKPPTQFGADFLAGVTDPAKQTGGTSGSSATQQTGFVGRLIPSLSFTNVTALISFFQSNQLGEVLSSPSVTVSSGKQGRIQVGQDFYITTRDFAGNAVQQAQSAGIIIDVKPTVYDEAGIKFINLDITAERSTISPGPIINKSSVKTYSVLNDGEETVIGGLYTTTESIERGGIPFLKDLPWWVFGLRYVFGYDKNSTSTQELIILLKAEVVPTIEERIATKAKQRENLIEKTRRENASDIEFRKTKKDKEDKEKEK